MNRPVAIHYHDAQNQVIDPIALAGRGKDLYNSAKFRDAIPYFNAAIDGYVDSNLGRIGNLKETEWRANSLFSVGARERNNSFVKAAIQDYNSVLDSQPGRTDVRLNRGLAYNQSGLILGDSGRQSDAFQDFKRSVADLDCLVAVIEDGGTMGDQPLPRNINPYLYRGKAKVNSGDLRGGVLDFQNALKRNPSDTDARTAFAAAEQRMRLVSDRQNEVRNYGNSSGGSRPVAPPQTASTKTPDDKYLMGKIAKDPIRFPNPGLMKKLGIHDYDAIAFNKNGETGQMFDRTDSIRKACPIGSWSVSGGSVVLKPNRTDDVIRYTYEEFNRLFPTTVPRESNVYLERFDPSLPAY